MSAKEPDYVMASKGHCQMEKSSFEEMSKRRSEITTAALVWDTNSYFVDVDAQVFVVNGGKKIRFDEWPIQNPVVALVRRNQSDFMDGKKTRTSSIGYFLGIEGTWKGQPRMVLMEISPDGSSFRFKTSR